VHTVGHFVGEALESISHADSRLWRTLGYLLTRPGFLTREFFAGRRVAYLPAFRLYLVLSVVFFLVAASPGRMVQIERQGTPAERAQALEQAASTLEGTSGNASADAARQAAADLIRRQAAEEAATPAAPPGRSVMQIDSSDAGHVGGSRSVCDRLGAGEGFTSAWRDTMRERCRTLSADGGRALGTSVVRNLPRAMFIFLPVLAFFMMLLYWRPHRYYVEHLLFLVHNHCFVFLVLTLMILVGRIPVVGEYTGWPWLALWIYIAWYLYRGMRNFYEQRRALTIAKYLTLGFAYIISGLLAFALTALYSVITA
jgi:hypothetical protein